ncbi:hypothetical protein CK501_05575 [Halovibrio salipaludis]|uniref:DUF2970 domain-containing protein n=1 Tax=Halovibrio salipaludis TaxID=2032626 RepID=A0A2A2F8I9_9GAMM|nr:DUF2970 domain-containing protein [Halospina sp. K52047b]PAU81034.1 hypothetical protein CK501_05575 [Halovibrio salipaludis]
MVGSNQPTGGFVSHSDQNKPGLWQVVFSILAAALGVNSESNRQKDFSASSPWPFIIGGIIFGVVFVVGIALIVKIVLESTGAA